METIINVIFDPIAILIIGLIIVWGFYISSYDIQFEDGEEIEI